SCSITNRSGFHGAGISFESSGTLTVTGSTISSCHAPGLGAAGGALYVAGNGAVRASVFESNTASAGTGGAVHVASGTFDLENCRITGTAAEEGGGVFSYGIAGLYSSTVVYNKGTTQGGGVASPGGAAGPLTLTNSIVAGNGHIDGLVFVDD